MNFLISCLLFLHILGAAAIVGAWFATIKNTTVLPIQLWGAVVQFVTGLLFVGIAGSTHEPMNYAKIAVKLVFAAVVLVTAIIGYRKVRREEPVPTGIAHATGGFALINIAVATLWH